MALAIHKNLKSVASKSSVSRPRCNFKHHSSDGMNACWNVWDKWREPLSVQIIKINTRDKSRTLRGIDTYHKILSETSLGPPNNNNGFTSRKNHQLMV